MTVFDTDLPLAAAPMAGGASSIALLAAVTGAGAFGFLPTGYQAPAATARMLAEARSLQISFGVNVFVPSPDPMPAAEFRRYAETIAPEGVPYGLELATAEPVFDDDHWQDKIDLLLADAVPVVSFTFGRPTAPAADALRRAGSRIAITVTSAEEAAAAEEAGADLLIVQGSAAGAHSGTATPEHTPADLALTDLIRRVRRRSRLPVIAAGGLAKSDHIRDILAAGAAGAMVGTALLRTDESGASQVHKDALVDPHREATVMTRAFTGRPARGLRNTFTDRYSDAAPIGYPEIHHLTRELRRAATAAGDPEAVHLWAGTGHRHAASGPASAVIADLAAQL